MYDHMRNEMATDLQYYFSEKDTMKILSILDKLSEKYIISAKDTGLTVYNYEMPELVRIYIACKKISGLSDKTLDNYYSSLQVFFRDVRKAPSQITSNDIRVWLFKYQNYRKISNRTLDQYRGYICRFFKWAFNEKYIPDNPAKSIEPIKYAQKNREAMTQIELEYIRMACVSLRDKAIIEFLYSTGCRVSEMSNVKKSDIDWNDKSVKLFGKGSKTRKSYLNAKAEVAIKQYLDNRSDDSDYLFVSSIKPHGQLHKAGIEKIVKIIVSRLDKEIDKKITPHVFRHTTATIALNNGMPISDISKLLGHENIDTTMIYAKTSMEDIRMGHRKYIV